MSVARRTFTFKTRAEAEQGREKYLASAIRGYSEHYADAIVEDDTGTFSFKSTSYTG